MYGLQLGIKLLQCSEGESGWDQNNAPVPVSHKLQLGSQKYTRHTNSLSLQLKSRWICLLVLDGRRTHPAQTVVLHLRSKKEISAVEVFIRTQWIGNHIRLASCFRCWKKKTNCFQKSRRNALKVNSTCCCQLHNTCFQTCLFFFQICVSASFFWQLHTVCVFFCIIRTCYWMPHIYPWGLIDWLTDWWIGR